MRLPIAALVLASALSLACERNKPAPPYGRVLLLGPSHVNGDTTLSVFVEFPCDRVEVLDQGAWREVPPPYRFVWSPGGRPDGTYRLLARASTAGGSVESGGFDLVLDRTPPRLVSVTPAPGGSGMPAEPFVVEFDEPVLPDSRFVTVTSAARGPLAVAVTAADGTGKRLAVTRHFLTAPDDLSITLQPDLTDLAGNPLGASYTWSFRLWSPWELLGGGPVEEQPSARLGQSLFVAGGSLHATTGLSLASFTGGAWQIVAALPGGGGEYTTDGTDAWLAWAPSWRWNGSAWEQMTTALPISKGQPFDGMRFVIGSAGPIVFWTEKVLSSSGWVTSSSLHAAVWDGSRWASVPPLPSTTTYVSMMDVVVRGGVPHILYFDGDFGWQPPFTGKLRVARLDPAGLTLLPGSIPSDGTQGALSADLWVAAPVSTSVWAELTTWQPGASGWHEVGTRMTLPVAWTSHLGLAIDGAGDHFLTFLRGRWDLPSVFAVHVFRWDGERWVEPWGILNANADIWCDAPRLSVDPSGAMAVIWADWAGSASSGDEYRTYVKRLTR